MKKRSSGNQVPFMNFLYPGNFDARQFIPSFTNYFSSEGAPGPCTFISGAPSEEKWIVKLLTLGRRRVLGCGGVSAVCKRGF